MTYKANLDIKYEKVHSQITDESQSALGRYQRVVVGSSNLAFTLKYELVTGLLSNFPGALGLWLRQRYYKTLFKKVGRGVIFGRGVTIRHPQKISLGDAVVVSDGCLLDARGDSNAGITVGDDVVIGQDAKLICKDGDIKIGNNVGIGNNSIISAIAGNIANIGDNVLIAPYTYIGGVSYHFDRTDVPIALQGHDPRGGIQVEKNAWLGIRVTVLDGSTIGNDAIIAAGAVVTEDVPPFAIAAGVPAQIKRHRK